MIIFNTFPKIKERGYKQPKLAMGSYRDGDDVQYPELGLGYSRGD